MSTKDAMQSSKPRPASTLPRVPIPREAHSCPVCNMGVDRENRNESKIYAKSFAKHMKNHLGIFSDSPSNEFICRYCPCDFYACPGRFVDFKSLVHHLWMHHSQDLRRNQFETHMCVPLQHSTAPAGTPVNDHFD
jgi:hypothetical protein